MLKNISNVSGGYSEGWRESVGWRSSGQMKKYSKWWKKVDP